MDNGIGSVNPERYVPQQLQPGILLESANPTESPPPYSECVQMQFTPYSYYGFETHNAGDTTRPVNTSSNNQEQYDEK